MSTKQRSSDLLEACAPRWATPHDPTRESFGDGIIEAARILGKPFMPWQEQVARVAGELLPDGTPAYREVIFSTPRQSGKTTEIEAWLLQRAVGWAKRLGEPQRMMYSAQTGGDAREKLLTDFVPDFERVRSKIGLGKIARSNGHEAVNWTNGSKLSLLASLADSGHGFTLDADVKDELFADTDYRRDQALRPAKATRPHAQGLTCSTMGTPESIAWNQKVAAGRAAVEAGKNTGIAYFEWSARRDDDPADPATWWSCMPALGRTITLATVEAEWEQKPTLGDFMRAWLNISTVSDEQVIPALLWDLVQSNTAEAQAVIFGLDVNPDRDWGSIVACDRAPTVEVVHYQAGTGWIVERCRTLHEKYGIGFVIDGKGPAAGFVPELERENIPVTVLSVADVVAACGRFYDLVVDSGITIRRHAELDHAVAGAVKRPVGDAWAWARKSSRVDISLLVAATVALWQASNAKVAATTNLW